MLAQKVKEWSACEVEERHVIIENVLVGDLALGDGPYHMRILSLIGIDSEMKDGEAFQNYHDSQERDPQVSFVARRRKNARGPCAAGRDGHPWRGCEGREVAFLGGDTAMSNASICGRGFVHTGIIASGS